MFPYYLLIGMPMLLSVLKYNDNNRIFNKRFPLFIFFTLLIAMLSLRSVRCGVDLVNYRFMFNTMRFIPARSWLNILLSEPGFDLFVLLNRLLSDNFQFFLFSCAIVSMIPIMCLYTKEADHAVLTIALFICIAPFTLFFSGLRQSIAIGLGVICYSFSKKDKLVPFLLFAFLAFLFHQSAVILLPMYPLMHIKLTKKWIVPIAVLYVVCILFNKEIFGVLLGLSQRYASRYTISDTGSYTFLVLLLLLTVFAFAVLRDDATEVLGLRNLLVFSLFLQCFAPINTVAMRLNYYYLIFVPLLIPKIIDNSKNRYRQLASLALVLFVLFFIFWFFKEAYTGADIMRVFPYVPFWET